MWERFIVASDVHGDKQDPAACAVFFDFLKTWRPQIRVFAGDLWDFRPLRKKASAEEQRESMAADYEKGLDFLKGFQPNVFLRGNHDERLWELAESNNGILSDFASEKVLKIKQVCERMGCQILPYNKREGVVRIGHLKILHGFASGVYASRQHALVYGSCLFGHTHAVDEHAIPGLERRVARNIGCLCQLDMDYNARHMGTLKQAHGFAYGITNPRTGDYFVWQAEQIGGAWAMPSGIEIMKDERDLGAVVQVG